MSNFPSKKFQGTNYTFGHLASRSTTLVLPVTGQPSVTVPIQVGFGCHCFTEAFDPAVHLDHHRYVYRKELRAFDVIRYECSLQLPAVVQAMIASGTVYASHESYTYVAQLSLPGQVGPQNYSVFFSLERDRNAGQPALRMFIKSGYLKALASPAHSKNWRFTGLAGLVAGVYVPAAPKPKPVAQKRKKGP